ncbi:MAG: hypothetical protein WBV28_23955 [Terracidiphilus sp.]
MAKALKMIQEAELEAWTRTQVTKKQHIFILIMMRKTLQRMFQLKTSMISSAGSSRSKTHNLVRPPKLLNSEKGWKGLSAQSQRAASRQEVDLRLKSIHVDDRNANDSGLCQLDTLQIQHLIERMIPYRMRDSR